MPRLPKSYITKYGITKNAWNKYKASLKKRKTKKTSTSKKTTRTRSRSRAKTINNTNSKPPFTIPFALAGGALAGHFVRPYANWVAPIPGIIQGIQERSIPRIRQAFGTGVLNYTGWRKDNHSLDLAAAKGLHGELIGFAVHEVVGKRLGVNRRLGQARIPVVRI